MRNLKKQGIKLYFHDLNFVKKHYKLKKNK